MLLYADRISPFLLLIPVDRGRAVRVHARRVVPGRRRSTCSSATWATSCATSCGSGSTCRPPCTAWPSLDASATFQQNPLLRTLAHANPFAILFESYRAVIYGQPDGPPHAPDWLALFVLLAASIVLAGDRGRRLQAPRADLREGALADGHRVPAADLRHQPARHRRDATSASATRCASRRRRRSAKSLGQMLSRDSAEPFWALRNVSFGLVRGESLAVIGPERRRQVDAAPGPRRDHPAVGGHASRSTATSRAC